MFPEDKEKITSKRLRTRSGSDVMIAELMLNGKILKIKGRD